jgi:putative ABC transport system permease protein
MTNWIFTLLAFQNLMRRPVRTAMLLLAVALGTGAIFASYTVARGIEASMQQSFSRMGADLVVVPQDAMLNITSALLTVQPTEASMPASILDQIAKVDGVAQIAPQTIYRVPTMSGMPECKANLIAYDPARDFTVTPWLSDHLDRPLATGDVYCGGRRSESLGDEIEPCNSPATVYGKLARSGVGPLDESLFATYDTVEKIAQPKNGMKPVVNFDRSKVSAVLVRLAFGATPEQVRFEIAKMPGVKVITAARIVTSARQTTTALLGGMLGFTVMMLMGSLVLVSLLFGAIITERKRELGLLRAIGTRRADIVRMLISEASFATGLGGVFGILIGGALLLLFERTLVYQLEALHVQFAWPAIAEVGIAAVVCALLAVFVGLLGALIPAWNAGREDISLLISGEGA